MAKFAVGKPITTTASGVVVDAGLAVGFHRFRLNVADTGGNLSRPAEVVVEVRRPSTTPVLTPMIGTATPAPIRSPRKPSREPS